MPLNFIFLYSYFEQHLVCKKYVIFNIYRIRWGDYMNKKITTLADIEEEYNKLIKINEGLRKELKETRKELSDRSDLFNKFYQRYTVLENEYKCLKKEYEKVKIRSDKFAPMQRQISDEQVKEIKKLRAEGKTYREIRLATGWSNVTISRVLKGVYGI